MARTKPANTTIKKTTLSMNTLTKNSLSILENVQKDNTNPTFTQADLHVETKDAQILEEFQDFYKDFPELKSHYKLIHKIGEGTFSSVYKAMDLKHYEYNNADWCQEHLSLKERLGISQKEKNLKKEKENCGCVALKRIYVTSSPERIMNELSILHLLR